MSLSMPLPDLDTIARRGEIVVALRAIVPGEGVIDDEKCLRPYESDSLTAYRQLARFVVLPSTTEQVSRILAWCLHNRVKVVPGGSGTSLSGGTLPLPDAVLLGLGKMNRIFDIDYDGRIWIRRRWTSFRRITGLAVANVFHRKG